MEGRTVLTREGILCRKNEVDHVAQHWTHDLRRIQQFGTMPFEELKGLLSEEDYKKSVDEWERQTKNKKWCHMTMDTFINFMYQVACNSVYQIGSCRCRSG